jgi:hypothetical protein
VGSVLWCHRLPCICRRTAARRTAASMVVVPRVGCFRNLYQRVCCTVGWGAITIYIEEQVNGVDQALQRQAATRPLFWHLTDYNKNALGFALDQTPQDKRFEVLIQCLPDATSRTYVEDLANAFLAHQWSVKANCLFSQLKPDFLGVEIAVSGKLAGRQLSDIPDNTKRCAWPADLTRAGHIDAPDPRAEHAIERTSIPRKLGRIAGIGHGITWAAAGRGPSPSRHWLGVPARLH